MAGSFKSDVEDYEDYAGVNTSSMHEDRSDAQPSFEDETIEDDTASTPPYLHTPHFPHRTVPPHPRKSR